MKSTQLIDPLSFPPKRIPLGVILTLSFAALTVIAVGLTGYLSFHNGRQAVNEVAGQLRREITSQIERQLESFLETSLLINRINASAVEQGVLEVDDPAALERYFWEQMQTFDTATSIYFGNIHGGLADAGREAGDNQPYVIATDGFQAGPFRKYATDDQGNRAELLQTVPNFDARTRPWYTRAVDSGQPVWSDIYILFTGQDMALAASQPVYDAAGRLLGVLANDIFLSDLSDFLQSLAIGRRGEAFIVEHSGLLVASSTDEPLLIPGDSGQPPQRLHVADSSVPLVRAGLAQVMTEFGGLASVESNQQFEFELEGERYFGQVAPFQAVAGLDWLIVVVIPEADFMAPIATTTSQTWGMILATLGLALAGGFLVAQRVARPLAALSRAAKALAQGEPPPPVPLSRIEEVGDLTDTFNRMALQLNQTLERLTAEVAEREQAEEDLQESRDQLAGIIGSAMDAIVTVDESQKVVFFNAAAEKMFGYTAAEIIGQPHDRLIPERLRATHWKHIEKFGQTGVTHRHMRHLAPLGALRADGQEFPVEVSISRVSVAGRKLYTAILRDIGEKLQREGELRQSEARYRSLFEDHPAVMFQLDPTDRAIVDANPAAAAFYGWSREELRGMKIEDVNTLSPAEIEAEIQRLHTSKKYHFNVKHRRADGSVRAVEVFTGPFHYQGRKLLYSIVQDVTERREAEEALRLNLERLSLATASAEIGIWEIEIATGTMIWDDRMYELYGLERETTALSPETWLRLVHPDDAPAVEATGRAALEGSWEYHLQFRINRPDGQMRHVEAQASVLRDEADRPLRVIGINRDITEQVLAAQTLAHSEARYRTTLDNMLEGCQIIDFDWRYRYVNNAVAIQGKTTREALLGQTMMAQYPGIEQTEMFARLRRCMEERTATHLENEFIFPDGSKGWFELSVQPVPEGLFILSMDITERKQAAESLAQSEIRYRAVVNDQTEFICRYTPDFVLTFVNEAYCRLFNRPLEELVGQNLMQLIRPENRQPLRDKVASLTWQEPVAHDQHPEIGADGSLRWLHWTDRGIFDEAGQLVEIQAVGRDITPQVEAQRQLEFQKTLLECELESSLDGVLIVSQTREWLYINQRFIEMWDFPPEVVTSRSTPAGLAHIKPQLAEPETFFADVDYVYAHPDVASRQEILLKDGRVFERYTAPVVSAAGDYYGRLWNYRDISRQKELEAQLLQSQKMEAVGRLAGGIAHDFNNILVPIVGYAELGLMKLSPEDKLYRNLTRVREAAERATGLTRQILAFSRKQVLQTEILDLNKVVEDFQKMTQRLIGEDIELQLSLEPALSPVNADPGQLGQVLLNLAVNARDAMPGGGQLTIETANVYLDEEYVKRYAEAQPTGHYVLLAVSDTGHGMSAQTRQQIFEPFFTTKERGKGTGLGLSTVFGIIKQHGGNIWVYSEPGQGATFKIYLPRAEGLAEAPEISVPEAVSTQGTETILVVEDEEMVRRLVCETLSAHGYQVLEAPSAAEALQLVAEHQDIHLLLTDVVMPEMNGRELSEKIVAIQPEVKVVFMSGYTDDVIARHGVLEEGVEFLQKPFTYQTLTRKVRAVLD